MGDEELRLRERAWRESRSLEDEVAYVIALQREGPETCPHHPAS